MDHLNAGSSAAGSTASSPTPRDRKRKSNVDPDTSKNKNKHKNRNSKKTKRQHDDTSHQREDLDETNAEQVSAQRREGRSQSRTDTYAPPSHSPGNEMIFSSFPLSLFSSSVPPALVRLFEEHGGTHITLPTAASSLSLILGLKSIQDEHHPLHGVQVIFVAGPDDAWCAILSKRVMVLFTSQWVEDSIDNGGIVGLGEYMVDPMLAIREWAVAGRGVPKAPGLTLETSPPPPAPHFDAGDHGLGIETGGSVPSNLGLVRQTRPDQQPLLDIDLLQSILTEQTHSRPQSQSQSQGQSHSPTPPSQSQPQDDFVSKLSTVHVDQVAFTNQSTLTRTTGRIAALKKFWYYKQRGTQRPKVFDDAKSEAQGGPSRIHSAPEAGVARPSRLPLMGDPLAKLGINSNINTNTYTKANANGSTASNKGDQVDSRVFAFESDTKKRSKSDRTQYGKTIQYPPSPPHLHSRTQKQGHQRHRLTTLFQSDSTPKSTDPVSTHPTQTQSKATIIDPTLKPLSDQDPTKVEAFKNRLLSNPPCRLDEVYKGLFQCETEDYRVMALEPAKLGQGGKRRR